MHFSSQQDWTFVTLPSEQLQHITVHAALIEQGVYTNVHGPAVPSSSQLCVAGAACLRVSFIASLRHPMDFDS